MATYGPASYPPPLPQFHLPLPDSQHQPIYEAPPRLPVSAHPGYGPYEPPRNTGQYPLPTPSPSETRQMRHQPWNGEYPPHYPRYTSDTPPNGSEIPPNGALVHGKPVPDDIYGPQEMPPAPCGAPPGSAGSIPSPHDLQASWTYGATRKRAYRLAKACDYCRVRRENCNLERPTCRNCWESRQICVYGEYPLLKQERVNALILEKLERMDVHMGHVQDSLSQLDRKIDELIQQREDSQPHIKRLKANETSIAAQNSARISLPAHGQSPVRELKEKDGIIGDLSIPTEHTTAAHKQLGWDTIKALLPAKTDPNYVMKGEAGRGLIRIYGRGEGSDKKDGRSSPTPSGGPWGTGHPGATAYDSNQTLLSELDSNWGGLNPNGTMHFHQQTVKELHENYMSNIHIMHPFLDPRILMGMIERFTSKYSPVARRSLGGTTARTQNILSSNHPSEPTFVNRVLPERTISNAIVLLVLALGKTCQWKDNLPGPTPSSPLVDVHRAQTRSVTASVRRQMDFPQNSLTQLPATSSSSSRNAVAPSERREPQKNIEVIPGMAYYAYATDILGNTQGGNDIPYVQAALLAGLYAGQLAHTFSSHAWIGQACRACQVLIRTAYLATETNDSQRDLISFAFWTCLQLESDILAELDLPASGISRYESNVDLPRGLSRNDPDIVDMLYYSAQVQLRRTLNRVHTELYKEKADQKGPPFGLVGTLDQELEDWRRKLPNRLSWIDSDSPASTINAARVRAKYYGAKCIVHRPLLHHALHNPVILTSAPGDTNPRPSESLSIRSRQCSLQGPPSTEQHNPTIAFGRHQSEMGPRRLQGFSLENLDPKVRKASEICIEAAMNSTTAFDGVDGRLIVTNIFGTAHAQFGNMVVLAATYNSHLRELVDEQRFSNLLDRTISFLERHASISPTLKTDSEILTSIKTKLLPSLQRPAAVARI